MRTGGSPNLKRVALWAVACVVAVSLGTEHVSPVDAASRHEQPMTMSMAPGMAAADGCAGGRSTIVDGQTLCYVSMGVGMRGAMTQMSSRPSTGAAAATAAPASGTSAAAVSGPLCLGDGTSGRRVQVLYMTTSATTVPDPVRTQLTTMLNGVDDIFDTSAAQLGGSRFVRWVTETASGGCRASVLPVAMTSANMSTFGTMTQALQALGYNRADRKYLIFAVNSTFCGIGSVLPDSSPGAANASNGTMPEYARVDNGQGCWTAATAAHEIGHTLGAVQLDAPHTTGGWHCTDANDIMCYSDAPGVVMSQVCPGAAVFDCNHDDYFSTDPAAGSYIAAHWNTANSGFLTEGGAQAPAPAAPSNVTLAARTQRLTVMWTPPPGTVFGSVVTLTSTSGSTTTTTTCSVLAAAHSCLFTGLTNGARYTASVVASNTSSSPPSSSVTVSLPGTFRPLSVATQIRSSTAFVAWAAPTDDGGGTPTNYTATAQPSGQTCSAVAPATACRIDGLTNGSVSTITVTASAAGWTSAPSDAISVTPPGTLTATSVISRVRPGFVDVSWAAPPSDGSVAGPVTSWDVVASPGSSVCSAIAPALTCRIAGLVDGTTYNFAVTPRSTDAVQPWSGVPSAPAIATVPGTFAAHDVTALRSGGTIQVSWVPPADDGGDPVAQFTASASPGGLSCTTSVRFATCTIANTSLSTDYTVTVVGQMVDGFPTVGSAPIFVASVPTPAVPRTNPPSGTTPTSTPTSIPGTPMDGTAPVTGSIVTPPASAIYSSAPLFSSVGPVRVFDTRVGVAGGDAGVRVVSKVKVGGGVELVVKVTDLVGGDGVRLVPAAGVGAVSLNVTATDVEGAGFVTVYPCGVRPLVSSLNVTAGVTVPNAVIAPVSAAGTVCFYSSVATDLIADVNGWFAAA